MLAARKARVRNCAEQVRCVIEAMRWTVEEVTTLSGPEATMPSGTEGQNGQAIKLQLRGLNNILEVYGLGATPRYPEIDGPPPDRNQNTGLPINAAYALWLRAAAQSDPATRLDPSIGLALALLDANDRGEASAYEPLDQRFNSQALEKAKNVDWRRYRYSSILVPGIGPDDLTTPLSARSILNVRMAAERFAQGLAPFLVVSGGNVHPRGTRFVEALEMRKALIERFGVPPDSIIVEPYARHTTTNLRNVTRRLMAIGAPLDKDVLIVTQLEQSQYIESAEFLQRNQTELGYQPGKVGSRLSNTELTFRPSAKSAQVDPFDPLDP